MLKYSKSSAAWGIASLAISLLIAPMASAQDATAATVQLEHNGAPGVWMPMATFRRSVDDLAAAEAREEQAALLTRQVELLSAQLADMQIMRDTSIAETETLREALDVALRDAARSRRTAQKARRRIGWSFGAGAVVAVAVGVLAALAAN